MKQYIWLTLFFLSGLAYSTTPSKISYQGMLKEKGILVNSTKTMEFAIYDALTGGNVKWTSGNVSVDVSQGVFRYVLEPTGFDWQSGPYYLQVTVEGTALTPREEILSSAYAIQSKTVDDGSITTSKIANGAVDSTKIKTGTSEIYDIIVSSAISNIYVLTVSSSLTVSDGDFSVAGSTFIVTGGSVGIGTTAPSERLHVYKNAAGEYVKIRLENADTTPDNPNAYCMVDMLAGVGNWGEWNTLTYGQIGVYSPNSNSPTYRGFLKVAGDSAGVVVRALDPNGIIKFMTGGMYNERLRISSSGNIGIGTANPEGHLHILSSSESDRYVFVTSHTVTGYGLVVSTSGRVGIGTASIEAGVKLKIRDDTSNATIMFNRGGLNIGQVGVLTDNTVVLIGNVQPIRFSANGVGNEHMRITPAGNIGISTTTPTARLHVFGAAGTVTIEGNSNETTASNNILMLRSDVASNDKSVFRVQANGAVFADGAFTGTGADYAEWFEKEGVLSARDVAGLNPQTGKVRVYSQGDILVGIVSEEPGFVGNQPGEKTGEDMSKNHALVALVGQVKVNDTQIKINGREIRTKDDILIGYKLSTGRVLLKIK